jgi:iron(III) transport system ATP-binding protein
MLLDVKDISIAYEQTTVVHDASFVLEYGDIGCLLGPSGCGKTTLLRAIAGFEKVSQGQIRLQHNLVSSTKLHVPPEQRRIGMVFQDFALFPHLNVADNVAFGIRKMPKAARDKRVEELLALVELPGYGEHYPHQLSGGQQQRVAIARAMAPRPALLLMDEPFSSLDVELRETLARDIRRILKKENITGLLVTHDQYEAFAMADKIGVINQGQVEQWDSPYNLYHQPQTRFVADFIGQGVLLPGNVIRDTKVETALGIIEGQVPEGCQTGCPVDILVRPDDIVYDPQGGIRATVCDKAFRGADFLYTLCLPNETRVLCLTPSHHDFAMDEEVTIRLDIDHLVVFRRYAPHESSHG